MEVELLESNPSWRAVADSARTTVGKEAGEGEPSSKWKKRILLAEHSPIRQLSFRWKWKDLKSWVSVHFVRHKFGIEHFVSTQRTDRTGIDRDSARQDTPVTHECIANAQAIMFISRRRLCNQASPETRNAWKAVIDKIGETQPELKSVCVPDCVYRGFCSEFKSCGFVNSPKYKEMIEKYRDVNNIE